MAYLNVRDGRLETRIVYVGPSGAGKATNLEQLGRRTSPQPSSAERSVTDDSGEIVALEWGSETVERFRDCQVFAHIVAPRGTVSAERTRALLRDVDGVVLVVDATPSSRDQNRASVALLRDALASAKRNVSVVVQINKTDTADALAAAAVLSDLGAAWPHVEAVAARGDGVVETIERALAGVLETLRAHPPEGESTTNGASGGTVRTEGNPLLDALRQVLRDTVAAHVAELEERFVAKLDGALEITALRKTVVDESARTRSTIDNVRNTVSSSVSETTRALAAHSGAIAALEKRFLDENELVAKIDALAPRIERMREEVRSEVVRVVEVQARADREHVATIAANLRRIVEQIAADVKDMQNDAKNDDAAARIAALDASLKKLDVALTKIGRTLTDDVRDVVIAHVVGVEEHVRGSGEGIAEVLVRLTELTEELKKKEKKGWFG